LNSSVIGTDETSMKFNGKKHWFCTWQNNCATFIAASANRGTATIDKPVSSTSNDATLVHDCWKEHFQIPVGRHQLCTTHLERETIFLEKLYKITWPGRFRDMLAQAQ
jgi:hypothetical protein